MIDLIEESSQSIDELIDIGRAQCGGGRVAVIGAAVDGAKGVMT